MHLFGICFLLYLINVSAGKGFWFHLRTTDHEIFKLAVKLERINKKVLKCKLDLNFLCKCRDTNITPNFTKLKQLKDMDMKARSKFYRKLLFNEISAKHKRLKVIKKEQKDCMDELVSKSTWMKRKCIIYSINFVMSKFEKQVSDRHLRKYDRLVQSYNYENGFTENPNNTIWNLSSHTLSNEEYEVIQYGLNYGLAMNLQEKDIIPAVENVWDQLNRHELLKNDYHSQLRAKNCLRALAYNLLDLENQQIFKDSKKLKIIRKLRETTAILKPDKGNGVVIVDIADYYDSLSPIFSDTKKFKKRNDDPTDTRLNTLQSYLCKLLNRGEITSEVHKEIRPENAKIARAHGLPKVHKNFDRVPPFRPIIDTTGSTHYGVGKYITNLLHPLTQNEFALKDTFDAADRINNLPRDLLKNEDYALISFDAVSLFTNVPLKRTVNIILDRVYKQKLIKTSLKKSTLKKLILDTCQKTAFLYNNQIYEQTDGVSMGASLGPVLANIIMTELEKRVVSKLINKGTIKFYARYVDDTLLLVKRSDIESILEKFNKFDKNLQFTVDLFENQVPHFLDLEICPDGIAIFRKDTHTGQYQPSHSFVPWKWKTAWMRSLITRAKKLCSKNKLHPELEIIKKFASWNKYPKSVVNAMIKRVLSIPKDKPNTDDDKRKKVYFNVHYAGDVGDQLVKQCWRKLSRCTKERVNFVTKYSVTKLSFFTNMKDKIRSLSKSYVIYEFACPGCTASYIGLTRRTLSQRTKEHATRDESSIKSHIDNCLECEHLFGINNLLLNDVDGDEFKLTLIRDNTKIIDTGDTYTLELREAFCIKQKKPTLNHGLKASKELQLF